MARGHQKAVDYWALGVLLYEFLVGVSAFSAVASDQRLLFRHIVMAKYEFPEDIDSNAKNLIGKLLVKSPTARLGNQAGGHKDVQQHPWFHPINFRQLVRKQLSPPWIPKISDPLDSSHFRKRGLNVQSKPSRGRLSDEQQALFKGF